MEVSNDTTMPDTSNMDGLTTGPNIHSFAPITSHDRAGYVWIAAFYCLTASCLVLGVRAYVKKSIFGKDDSVFLASVVSSQQEGKAMPMGLTEAQVFVVGHAIALAVSLNNGLGSESAPVSERQTTVASAAGRNVRCTGRGTLRVKTDGHRRTLRPHSSSLLLWRFPNARWPSFCSDYWPGT